MAPFDAERFRFVTAAVFIVLAALAMFGGFLPLASELFPVAAETPAAAFLALLAATCFVTIGLGLPVSMRIAAPLSAGVGTRGNLSVLACDAELWAKVVFQMHRTTLILCGFLVPGALLLIAYNIDGGPLLTALKWTSWIAMLISSAAPLLERPDPGASFDSRCCASRLRMK